MVEVVIVTRARHHRWFRVLAAGFGLVVVIAACGTGGTRVSQPETDDTGRTISSTRPGFPVVDVVIDENRFDPDVINLGIGDLVNINVVNQDGEAHDFFIDAPGIHTHPNIPVYIPVAPGASAGGELHAEQIGEFRIVCTVPGHEAEGHVATLIVS